MLDEYRPLRARGRRLEAKAGVTRGLRGVDLARDRQRKRAKAGEQIGRHRGGPDRLAYRCDQRSLAFGCRLEKRGGRKRHRHAAKRSEEHTSELQSLMRISYAVFCLTKKKKQTKKPTINPINES